MTRDLHHLDIMHWQSYQIREACQAPYHASHVDAENIMVVGGAYFWRTLLFCDSVIETFSFFLLEIRWNNFWSVVDGCYAREEMGGFVIGVICH